MGTKLYVGNLPFSVTDEDLKSLFSSYGEITEAVLIKDKFSGDSRGFGFVTMSNDTQGQAAIDGLNGKDMGGRALTVNLAKPKTEGSRGGGGGGGRGNW